LRVILFDKYDNMVKQCQQDFELMAFLLNATRVSKYTLFGSTRGISDCQGSLEWCYTRVTYSGVIQLNISSPYFNKSVASSINVTGQGAPSQIAIVTPQSQIASAVQAGGIMSSIQIQVTNAVGIALRRTDGIVVKIRVIPKGVSAVRYETLADLDYINYYFDFSHPPYFLQGSFSRAFGRFRQSSIRSLSWIGRSNI
jgi:hypothetical protein